MKLLPGLLDDPGRDGVDHLAVEEHHLEEHDEELDHDDLGDELELLLPDGVDECLDAGEAAHDQQAEEEPEQRSGRPRNLRFAGEVGEHLRQGRHQRVGEDRGLERAPDEQDHEGEPWHAGPEVLVRHPARHRHRQGDELAGRLEDELHGEVGQRGQPADHHGPEPDDTDPVHPGRAGRIPPRQQNRRDEFDPSRPERQRVHGKPGAPGGGETEEHGEQEQDVLDGCRPDRRGVEEVAEQDLLQLGHPGDRRREQLGDLAPRLRYHRDEPVNHLHSP